MGSLVRLFAILCSGLVLLGFAYFATDEIDRGSKTQQSKLDRASCPANSGIPPPIAPSPVQEAAREKLNGGFREAVDDANDVLLGPFTNLIDSNDRWVSHGVPAVLALLLYGLGLGTLANMLPKQREHAADWRAPPELVARARSPSCAFANVRRAQLPLPGVVSRKSKSSAESGRPPGRPERGNQLGGSRATRGRIADRVPHSASSSASPSANPVGPKGRGHG